MKSAILKQIHKELAFQSILAMGRTAPNPPVACVLALQEGSQWHLIGGATESPGKRHAEIVCLDSYHEFCKGKKNHPKPIKLYVSLEPCGHHGRTAPCTERILSEASVKSVLAWERDPLLKESGIAILRQKKCRARLLAAAQSKPPATSLGEAFLGGFFTRANKASPRFHLKAACSQDALMGLRGHKVSISQEPALRLGRLLRAKFDAVVVAMGTILSDTPRLDLRWSKNDSETLPSDEPSNKPKQIVSNVKDLFFQTLFREKDRLIQHLGEKNLEYQPERIFILGTYDSRIADFLALQKELSSHTGKEAVFLVEESRLPQWHKARPSLGIYASVPDLSRGEDFALALRKLMAERQYNEVLIEGGAGLFGALEKSLEKEDRIYILRSLKDSKEILKRNALKVSGAEDLIFTPSFMQKAPLWESYDLGGDHLELRRPSLSVLF